MASRAGGLPEDGAGFDLWVGDIERQAVDLRLQRAVGSGHLSLSEYDGRVQAVWCARTRGELIALAHGLPDLPAPAVGFSRPSAAASRWRGRGVRAGVAGVAVVVAWAGLFVASGSSESVTTAAATTSVPDGVGDAPQGIVVAPGQPFVDLSGVVRDALVVVPDDDVWVDVSALQTTGSVDCLQACGFDAERRGVLTLTGRFDGDLEVLYRSRDR